ncbi:hypothetical protein ND922_11875 [Vibrio diabolicus]|uniref:hypothetical protein n=1 Tax=Vibrio diabolicus TaxID=50719 RepID=UPI002160AFEE|nr:hypothetical protein [Vibrio diabolicus]MCS0369725.1 hypothetical protein [Vibrio diabolicus]
MSSIEFEDIWVYRNDDTQKCFLWAVESNTHKHHKLELHIQPAYVTGSHEVFFSSNLKKFVFSLVAETEVEAKSYRDHIEDLVIKCSSINAFDRDLDKKNAIKLSALIAS